MMKELPEFELNIAGIRGSSRDPKRILIIGGSSYVGGQLTRFLSKDYSLWVTYCHHPVEYENCTSQHVDLAETDPFAVFKNQPPFDHVIWCAQANNYAQSLDYYESLMEVNVGGVQKTLAFCRTTGAGNFIYLSSGTVYKDPQTLTPVSEASDLNLDNYYGFSKYMAEKMCQHYATDSDMTVQVLRLYTIYGPHQAGKVIAQLRDNILARKEIVLNGGVGMYFTALYIDDLGKILRDLIEQKKVSQFEVLNVANPEIVNLRDICLTIGEVEQCEVMLRASDQPITYAIADVSKTHTILPHMTYMSVKEGLMHIKNADPFRG